MSQQSAYSSDTHYDITVNETMSLCNYQSWKMESSVLYMSLTYQVDHDICMATAAFTYYE